MKYLISLCIALSSQVLYAQHLVYMVDGTKMPGKVTEITNHKVKFKNLEDLTGPTYSRAIEDLTFAFNATGSYLIFTKDRVLTKKEKEDFINPPFRTIVFDVLVSISGNIEATTISSENSTDILCTLLGRSVKVPKTSLFCLIRRDGTHQLFASAQEVLVPLTAKHEAINNLQIGVTTVTTTEQPAVAMNTNSDRVSAQTVPPAKPSGSGGRAVGTSVVTPNSVDQPLARKEFEKKALEKTSELTGYLKTITAVNTNNAAAKKAINLACDLFSDENARVEVSNINNPNNNRYKIRDYLNRLMIRSGMYDKVQVEYADINYVSKFIKGTDGNYHGTVSFVQRFKGLIDGKPAYEDITERTVQIIVKPYQKAVNGESVLAWDVFLGDIGIKETRKI